jgi:hypothetical protein
MSDWSETLLAESEERHFETLEQVSFFSFLLIPPSLTLRPKVLELSKKVDADQEAAQYEQMAVS